MCEKCNCVNSNSNEKCSAEVAYITPQQNIECSLNKLLDVVEQVKNLTNEIEGTFKLDESDNPNSVITFTSLECMLKELPTFIFKFCGDISEELFIIRKKLFNA